MVIPGPPTTLLCPLPGVFICRVPVYWRVMVRGAGEGSTAGVGGLLAGRSRRIGEKRRRGVVRRIAVTLALAAEILIAGRMLTLPVPSSAAGPGGTPSRETPAGRGG